MNLVELKQTDPSAYQALLAQAIQEAPQDMLESRLQEITDPVAANRAAYKSLVAEALPKAVEQLIADSEQLSQSKKAVFSLFEQIVALRKELYGSKADQQTYTFRDCLYRLTLGYRIVAGWDDEVKDGIAKMTDFINTRALDDNSKTLVKALQNYLKPDKNGLLKRGNILNLQKMRDDFKSAQFDDAVKIIMDAWNPQKSCWYIEASEKDAKQKWRGIPLSIASVDFPADYEFKGF